jgi:hypothetical protein
MGVKPKADTKTKEKNFFWKILDVIYSGFSVISTLFRPHNKLTVYTPQADSTAVPNS